MLYRKLGASGLDISVVTLGTIGMGFATGGVDDNASIKTIHAAVDAGINIIDTAQPYGNGHSEEVVGRALKGLQRDKIIVATKCGSYRTTPTDHVRTGNPETIKFHLEGSLKRLGVDYIDLLQMHWPAADVPIAETFATLNEIRNSGVVRFVGVSNFSAAQMSEAAKYCPIVSLQPPFSILDRAIEDEILPYCADNNIGVISYGSIGGGVLTGKFMDGRPTFDGGDIRAGSFYPYLLAENWDNTMRIARAVEAVAKDRGVPMVQVSINWVLATRGMTSAIAGARTPEQVVMNAGSAEWSLTDAEIELINNASKA